MLIEFQALTRALISGASPCDMNYCVGDALFTNIQLCKCNWGDQIVQTLHYYKKVLFIHVLNLNPKIIKRRADTFFYIEYQ